MTVKLSAAAILKAAEEKEASLPSVNVNDRLLDQEQDLGNLLGWDENQINCKLATDSENIHREEYLTKLARDNTQVQYMTNFLKTTKRYCMSDHNERCIKYKSIFSTATI